MFKFLSSPLIIPVLLLLALSGCAYAPGLYLTDGAQNIPENVIPITPDLVKQQNNARAHKVSMEIENLLGAYKPYTIGPGDVLSVVVWDHPEFNATPVGFALKGIDEIAPENTSNVGSGYNVSPHGEIQFPYIGSINVSGMTEYGVRDRIIERLAKILQDPQVTVRIQSYRSNRLYLEGEVRTPGVQTINDIPSTLPEAISRAGGFTEKADRSNISVVRDGQTHAVNWVALIQQGIDPDTIFLKAGDLVRVPSREDSKVFVLGAVLRPSFQILRDGRLSLNEALGLAGGIDPSSGDPGQIFVLRTQRNNTDSAQEQHQVFHLDASTAANYLLSDDFQLRARDVVYVDPVPLVRWNRVINLLLPGVQVVNSTNDVLPNGIIR